MRIRKRLAFLLVLPLVLGDAFSAPARGEVRLPKVFGSHLVLQQEKPLVVWGWAQPNETVTVLLGSQTCQVQANDRGEWEAVLPAMKAGGPDKLTMTGSSP